MKSKGFIRECWSLKKCVAFGAMVIIGMVASNAVIMNRVRESDRKRFAEHKGEFEKDCEGLVEHAISEALERMSSEPNCGRPDANSDGNRF